MDGHVDSARWTQRPWVCASHQSLGIGCRLGATHFSSVGLSLSCQPPTPLAAVLGSLVLWGGWDKMSPCCPDSFFPSRLIVTQPSAAGALAFVSAPTPPHPTPGFLLPVCKETCQSCERNTRVTEEKGNLFAWPSFVAHFPLDKVLPHASSEGRFHALRCGVLSTKYSHEERERGGGH